MAITNEQARKATQVIIKNNDDSVSSVIHLQDTQIGTAALTKKLTVTGDIFVESGLRTADSSSYIIGSGSISVMTQSNGQLIVSSSVISQYLKSDFTTTNTTRTNTNFTFPVNAFEIWEVEFDGAFGCSSANGVQIGWSVPTGTTAFTRLFGCLSAANDFSSTCVSTVNALIAFTFSSVSGPAARYGRAKATIIVGATGGSITLQAAVVTAGTARIYAGSHFTAQKAVGV